MTTLANKTIRTQPGPDRVTGVQLMQGIGVRRAKGFWADAWEQVLRRRAAVAALCWIGLIAFFAVTAPIIASGHPLILRQIDTRTGADAARGLLARLDGPGPFSPDAVRRAVNAELALHSPRLDAERFVPATGPGPDRAAVESVAAAMRAAPELDQTGGSVAATSPLLRNLTVIDAMALVGGLVFLPWALLRRRAGRAARVGALVTGTAVSVGAIALVSYLQGAMSRAHPPAWAVALREVRGSAWLVSAGSAAAAAIVAVLVMVAAQGRPRLKPVLVGAIITALAAALTWTRPLERFDYLERQARGEARAVYTLIPWSPTERHPELNGAPPGTTLGAALGLNPGAPGAGRTYLLGTDAFGQDVLSQILHACRLSITIGLVSTGISVLIGVTLGALMGYFGGWVDIALYRIVEIFMVVPVLFLLIVAASVLPDELRTTYVMMAIIGLFSWTGAARFTRAEFMKLRGQDFVQSAEAVGLPLRSVLFRHMLPNGVTPVLVDASFAIAAAISIEATLSFLGLGPVDQPSWGKLLSSAAGSEGVFRWWLALFPGAAIFLSILSYNLVGEALRDAIDPKLKKARV